MGPYSTESAETNASVKSLKRLQWGATPFPFSSVCNVWLWLEYCQRWYPAALWGNNIVQELEVQWF